jgi:hypothetical protein
MSNPLWMRPRLPPFSVNWPSSVIDLSGSGSRYKLTGEASLALRLRLASGICCTNVIAAGSGGGSAAGGVSAKLALKK